MPIRKTFVMQLKPGFAEEYQRRHDQLWPEMAELLRSHGVGNYSISLLPETGQLFAYAEIESEELWQKIPESPQCQKWWAYMGDIMKTHPDNSPQSTELREAFYFE